MPQNTTKPNSKISARTLKALRKGRFDEAKPLLSAHIERHPNDGDALNKLGIVFAQTGEHDRALECFDRAAQLMPRNPDPMNNRSASLFFLKRFDDAAEAAKQAVLIDGTDIDAQINLANAVNAIGESGIAEKLCKKLIKDHPSKPQPYQILSNIYADTGELHTALQVITLANNNIPDNPLILNTAASLHVKAGQQKEAITALSRLRELTPDNPGVYVNLLKLLAGFSAVGAMRDVARLAAQRRKIPDSSLPEIFGSLFNVQMFSWILEIGATRLKTTRSLEYARFFSRVYMQTADIETALEMMEGFFGRTGDAEALDDILFLCLYIEPDEPFIKSFQHRYDRVQPRKILKSSDCSVRDRKPRIGLVSGDLKNHSVSFFLTGWIGKMEDRFEMIGVPTTPVFDKQSKRIKENLTDWVAFRPGFDDFSAFVESQGFDILLDLTGHTQPCMADQYPTVNRPVAAYLGWSAPVASPGVDYWIGDQWVFDATWIERFHHQAIMIKGGFLNFELPPWEREELEAGMAMRRQNDTLVRAGCFNLLAKLREPTLRAWANALRRAPNLRLYLQSRALTDPAVRSDWLEKLSAAGIDTARVKLLGGLRGPEYYGLFRHLDFTLDTFPYAGTTVNCKTLLAGSPILTQYDHRFIARVGRSINEMAGLGAWNVASYDAYADLMVQAASDPEFLRESKKKALAASARSQLFDGFRFASAFGDGLDAILRQSHSGLS